MIGDEEGLEKFVENWRRIGYVLYSMELVIHHLLGGISEGFGALWLLDSCTERLGHIFDVLEFRPSSGLILFLVLRSFAIGHLHSCFIFLVFRCGSLTLERSSDIDFGLLVVPKRKLRD